MKNDLSSSGGYVDDDETVTNDLGPGDPDGDFALADDEICNLILSFHLTVSPFLVVNDEHIHHHR